VNSSQINNQFFVEEHEQVIISIEVELLASRVPERSVGFAAERVVVIMSAICVVVFPSQTINGEE